MAHSGRWSTLSTLAVLAAVLSCASAASAGVLEGPHPRVREGNEAYAKGSFDAALKAYEDAERDLPGSAEIQYDKGNAYYKLGRLEDARRAFENALHDADRSLKPRDWFNLGNAFEKLGKSEEAITSFRQSLKVDPGFEPARHNLEVLLRRAKPPPQPDGGTDGGDGGSDGGDGGSPDSGGRDGGADGGADGGSPDGGSRDGGDAEADGGLRSPEDGGTQGDAGQEDGGMMSEPPPRPEEKPAQIDRQDAERLLDALRRNEKQFLMTQQKQRTRQRVRTDKDW